MVRLPADINMTCSEQVGAELASVLTAGVLVLVADMSATCSCDEPGAQMLVHTAQRAARRGARLHLLAPPAAALQVIKHVGAGQPVPAYPTLRAALADTLDPPLPPAATVGNTPPVPPPAG